LESGIQTVESEAFCEFAHILCPLYANFNQQESCGKISFTADVWSNGNLASFLAITSHWIACDNATSSLSLKAALIGFQRLKKRHTGRNLARAILRVIDRAGILAKVFIP